MDIGTNNTHGLNGSNFSSTSLIFADNFLRNV